MFHDIRHGAFDGAAWATMPVRPGADLAANEYGWVLLRALRRRPEMSSYLAFEIDRFLGVLRGGSPGEALAAPPPPRKRKPGGDKDAEDKLHATRTATRARVASLAPKRQPAERQPTQREQGRAGALEEQPEELDVDCSVFALPVMSPGSRALVQVFVHLATQARAAGRMARQFDRLAQRRGVQTLEVPIAHGEHLTFELSIRDIEVVEPVQQLRWLGRPRAVQFEAVVPRDLPIGESALASLVSRHGIPIGSIKFTIGIDAGAAGTLQNIVGDEAKRYTRAFVSYASEDRAAVLARVQMLRLASIEYFQDIDMDPGQRWEQELYRQIDRCDLFLLFWSQAAKDSNWVRGEVQYALGLGKRTPDIRPVVVEGPPVPLPWDELAHLHFNDGLVSSLAVASRN